MVEAYVKGLDLHSLTHSKIYDRPYEHCLKQHVEWLQNNGKDKEAKKIELERRIAKMVNFLTGYGGGAFGLQNVLAQQGIYMTKEECEDIINSFFRNYPALKQHISLYKRFMLENGLAVSMFGRVREFPEIYGEDQAASAKALRSGYNHLIQSTASDMMVLSLAAIEQLMRDEGLESVLVSTVHDALLIDAVRDELPKVHEIVMGVLNNMPDVIQIMLGEDVDLYWTRILPFEGDSEVGANYLDAIKVPSKDPIDWERLLTVSSR